MRRIYQGVHRDGSGNVIQSGTISVYLAGTSTAASIYTTTTSSTAVNSVTSDSVDGTFKFYTDDLDYGSYQDFDITMSKTGYISKTFENVDMKPVIGTYTVSADKTLPSDIFLDIPVGAIYSIASGKTLTIYSPDNIKAHPSQQIFSGSGTIAFTVKGVAYAEWWGIDGTSDDVQINAGLTAAGHIQLLEKTYDARAQISAVSNGSLKGKGNATKIDNTNMVGSGKFSLAINNVSNFTARDFYIDAQSANAAGTVNDNGIGIQIYGGATKILLKNIYLFDPDYIGIYIRTSAEDITFENVTVDTGCNSTQILVGIHTAETGNVRNINMSNIKLLNGYANGWGAWSPGTGTTENINVSNLTVRNFATTVQGYGIFGTTDAKDVNIDNFIVDTSTGVGSHGIHSEAIESWNMTNGHIFDIEATAANGMNISGDAKNSNFSNIIIKDCANRGVLVFDTANDNNFDNITVNGSASAFLMGGVRNTFTNIKAIDPTFGGTGDAISIQYSAEDLILNGYQITATGAGTTGAGLLFSALDMTSATVKNGRITGTITTPVKGNTGKVKAETASVRVSENVAAGDVYSRIVLALPPTQNYYIVSVYLSFTADITQNDTNYNTYTLRKIDSTGGSAVNITTAVTTKITAGTDFNDNAPVELAVANHPNANVAGGYSVELTKAVTGAGQAEVGGLLTINYVTY